jgi:hypothetical protein
MIGFKIWIRLDLDLFDRIWILQGATAVRDDIFPARIPIGIRVVANRGGSEIADFTSMRALQIEL